MTLKEKYDPDFVNRILNDGSYVLIVFAYHYIKTLDILYLPKLRKNGDYTMKCPLHTERTPSLRYSPKIKMFKCFGCGNGGNIITLYSKYFIVPYKKAIRIALNFKNVPAEIRSKISQTVRINPQLKIDFPAPPRNEEEGDDPTLPF